MHYVLKILGSILFAIGCGSSLNFCGNSLENATGDFVECKFDTSKLAIDGFSVKACRLKFASHSDVWKDKDAADASVSIENYLLIELELETAMQLEKTELLRISIASDSDLVFANTIQLHPGINRRRIRVVFPLMPVPWLERHMGRIYELPNPVVIEKFEAVEVRISSQES